MDARDLPSVSLPRCRLPLFGEGADARASTSTYVIYGVALPVALATMALGVVTYLGYRPLAPLLTNHTYRLVVAGALMGGGLLAILAIFLRYHQSVGFEPLERITRLLPRRVKIKEGDTPTTRILTPRGIKNESFSRLNDREAFTLPSIMGQVVYVHVRDGYYYKARPVDLSMDSGGEDACRQTGLAITSMHESALATRDKGEAGNGRLIDIEKDLVSRLKPNESVLFDGAYIVHHRSGIYTIENHKSDAPAVDVHTLLGCEPFTNRSAKKLELRDLLPRLKDEQSILFKGKQYVHICDGFIFESSVDDSSTQLVCYSDALEQVAPLGRKLKAVDLKRDLLPRMNDGEYIAFKGAFYLHVERGMWIKSDSPIGKNVSLRTVLKRKKMHKLAQLPTMEQILPYVDQLGSNQCIYFQNGNKVQVYARKQPTQDVEMAEIEEPTIDVPDRKGCLKKSLGDCIRQEHAPETDRRLFLMKSYSGIEANYRSVSLDWLKGSCPPPKSDLFPYGRENKMSDEERIRNANELWQIEEEFFDPNDRHVHFDPNFI